MRLFIEADDGTLTPTDRTIESVEALDRDMDAHPENYGNKRWRPVTSKIKTRQIIQTTMFKRKILTDVKYKNADTTTVVDTDKSSAVKPDSKSGK